ncbi:ejaculatory bulb-specific protein 3 [Aethina tumida]|uniref:ejaculatory bulb-specific protein 3 n=1 Tax=Aethina tumida TaxID=116153 RepID=UPI00096AE454|nr:ejaculatory bulb-specific protein 3 [Aethina tumida]
MKFVVILLGLVCAVYAEEKYTTKYDNINLDEILKSDRLSKRYLDCVLDKVKCTPDGEDLKKHIPDALQTNCSKCSEKQFAAVKKVLAHLIENKREWYDELAAKYDPEGNYKKMYYEQYKKEGLNL